MSAFFGLGKTRTFKPRKDVPEGTKQYQLRKYAEATLGSGNLRNAVKLPDGEDLNEWLAVHAVDFFNHLNMLYGTVTEFCTAQECPIMSAGPRYEYLWEDGVRFKRPTKLPAPEYVDALMNWAQALLDNEEIFPNKIGTPTLSVWRAVRLTNRHRLLGYAPHAATTISPLLADGLRRALIDMAHLPIEGVPFPRSFRDTIRTIFRRLFRVYAHLYSNHFDHICALGIEAHLNTSYRHFFLFVHEFDLVDKKELAPLDELNDAILAEDKTG